MDSENRRELLDIILASAQQKHEERYRELSAKDRTAELVLISWGFIFGGIAGLYQAGVLNVENIQQTTILFVPIILSLCICIKEVIWKQKRIDVPNIQELWKEYNDIVGNPQENYDYSLATKEGLLVAYCEAEEKNRNKLAKVARNLSYASLMIPIELILVAVFIVFKDLQVVL